MVDNDALDRAWYKRLLAWFKKKPRYRPLVLYIFYIYYIGWAARMNCFNVRGNQNALIPFKKIITVGPHFIGPIGIFEFWPLYQVYSYMEVKLYWIRLNGTNKSWPLYQGCSYMRDHYSEVLLYSSFLAMAILITSPLKMAKSSDDRVVEFVPCKRPSWAKTLHRTCESTRPWTIKNRFARAHCRNGTPRFHIFLPLHQIFFVS